MNRGGGISCSTNSIGFAAGGFPVPPNWPMTRPMTDFSSADKRAQRVWLIALLGTAVLSALWALFQWMELLLYQAGSTPFCQVGERLNCGALWVSTFAKKVHEGTGMPIAGWGLVWALAATFLSTRLIWDHLGEKSHDRTLLAARILAVGGGVAVFGLAGVSISMGTFCPTCLFTYVTTLSWAGIAFSVKPLEALGRVSYAKAASSLAVSLVLPAWCWPTPHLRLRWTTN